MTAEQAEIILTSRIADRQKAYGILWDDLQTIRYALSTRHLARPDCIRDDRTNEDAEAVIENDTLTLLEEAAKGSGITSAIFRAYLAVADRLLLLHLDELKDRPAFAAVVQQINE